MFLKAGALSLALLLASRLLGLARESAQAAAFGTSGLADVAVLMLTLPDWLAGLLASGALAYVLLPHWSTQAPQAQAAAQRDVARFLLLIGSALALAIWFGREPHCGRHGCSTSGISPACTAPTWWSMACCWLLCCG